MGVNGARRGHRHGRSRTLSERSSPAGSSEDRATGDEERGAASSGRPWRGGPIRSARRNRTGDGDGRRNGGSDGRSREAGAARDVPGSVLRLSALLEAGAVPHVAWRHLAESGDAAAQRIADRTDRGAAVAEAIGGEAVAPVRRRWGRRAAAERDRAAAWRDIAAAWEVAATVGAPLAESLRGMSRALRDAQETLDDVRVAMAEPTHTARLMSVLPFVGVVIALALGFDMIGVLTTPGAGLACLVAGLAMIAGGRLWTSGLIRAARPAQGTPGLHAELTAIALGGGVSLDRARALVAGATGAEAHPSSAPFEASADAGSATHGGASADDEVERVLDLSRRAGIPAIDLLRATAEQQRSSARTDGRVRAARLGTRLLLPLGACTLPAFLCLGVVPMLLAVLQTTSLPDL